MLEKRKPNRLQNYDYSQAGAYFVTICTAERKNVFWNSDASVGANNVRPLSDYGKTAERFLTDIPRIYNKISVPSYVIMPNHIHMIIIIETDENRRPVVAPTISQIIKQYKGVVTKEIGFSLWQKGFFDHIIRNEEDYLSHLQYINENPAKWENDEYY